MCALMLFQMEDTTDQIALRIPEIKPEIAFQTVEITLLIASITVVIVVEIAFQIVSKNDRIASSTIVTTALIQAATLPQLSELLSGQTQSF